MFSLRRYKVDVGYFKMVVDYYDRKCPCWGGKYICPCPTFVETENCRCGAVRAVQDPKAQNQRYKDYEVSFPLLAEIIKNGYKCPENPAKACFCEEFLENGECRLHAFEKRQDSS